MAGDVVQRTTIKSRYGAVQDEGRSKPLWFRHRSTYGAYALKATYQRNMMLSLLIVTLVILILLPVLPDKSEVAESCPVAEENWCGMFSTYESPFVGSFTMVPSGERRLLIVDGWIGTSRDDEHEQYLERRRRSLCGYSGSPPNHLHRRTTGGA